ncbi:MAG: hypothetical protein ABF649_21280 [Bacillus sp. (in: firmicutes)]
MKLIQVINNILRSVSENNRQVEIILYYASEDYQFYLDNHSSFNRKATIALASIEKDGNEKFLIYETNVIDKERSGH